MKNYMKEYAEEIVEDIRNDCETTEEIVAHINRYFDEPIEIKNGWYLYGVEYSENCVCFSFGKDYHYLPATRWEPSEEWWKEEEFFFIPV